MQGFAVVLLKQMANAEESVLHVRGTLPTHLGIADRSTAEAIKAFVDQQQRLPHDYETVIDRVFKRLVDVTILDSASSNTRHERIQAALVPGKASINIWCGAHRKTKTITYSRPDQAVRFTNGPNCIIH